MSGWFWACMWLFCMALIVFLLVLFVGWLPTKGHGDAPLKQTSRK
jgi:hypothetical protein